LRIPRRDEPAARPVGRSAGRSREFAVQRGYPPTARAISSFTAD
jgi:hypothetical protein